MNQILLGFVEPVRRGEEWIVMTGYLKNRSGEAIQVVSVTLTPLGGGAGVLETKRIEIAPLSTGGGVYKTYPPTAGRGSDGPCAVARPEPVRGFMLQPQAEARTLVWLRAAQVGSYQFGGQEVHYQQGGVLYREELPIGMKGSVALDGMHVRVEPADRECAERTGARILP